MEAVTLECPYCKSAKVEPVNSWEDRWRCLECDHRWDVPIKPVKSRKIRVYNRHPYGEEETE